MTSLRNRKKKEKLIEPKGPTEHHQVEPQNQSRERREKEGLKKKSEEIKIESSLV